MTVIEFPASARIHAESKSASRFDIFKGRIVVLLGKILNKLKMPGAISAIEIVDKTTGHKITVDISALYVRLSVNQRDFYFNRLSGRFDGTGSAID